MTDLTGGYEERDRVAAGDIDGTQFRIHAALRSTNQTAKPALY
jgi:hypothetical protein